MTSTQVRALRIAPEAFEHHPLVAAVEQRLGVVDFLRVIQCELARRAAELDYMYLHSDVFDVVEDGRAITREARQLRRLAELAVAEHRVMGPPPLDPAHPHVQQFVALLMERVVGVAHEVLPVEAAAALEVRLRTSRP